MHQRTKDPGKMIAGSVELVSQSLMANEVRSGRNVESNTGRAFLYLSSTLTSPCGVRWVFGMNGNRRGSRRMMLPRRESLTRTLRNLAGLSVTDEWFP